MEDNATTSAVRVRFVGDPADDFSGPTNVSMFGQDFEKGEFTTIEDPTLIRKLRGHSHFEVEGEGKVKATNVDRDELAPLGLEALKEVAHAEAVPFEDDTTKARLLKAIRAARKGAARNDD